MSIKDIIDKYKKKFNYVELKRKAKQLRTKTKDIGWYASSFKSFGQLGKYIDTHWVSVSKDQIATLNQTLYTITDIKIAINMIRYIIDAIINIIKIYENVNDKKNKSLLNNLVRVFRIISYMAIIALSIASVSLGLPGLMIALAALKLVVRIVNMVKNIKSYRRIRNEEKEFLATLPIDEEGLIDEKQLSEEQIKEKAAFTYKLKKRQGRFFTRSVSMFFSIVSLAIVVVAVVANPLFFATLIFVGIAATITTKIVYYIKDRRMIPYKAKPDYRVWTTKEIENSYQTLAIELGNLPIHAKQQLKEEIDDFDSEATAPPRTKDEINKEMITLVKALDDKKWTRGQLIFNLSLIAVIVGISIAGIIIANTLLLIPASLLTGALLVIQFIIPAIKKKIQAGELEAEKMQDGPSRSEFDEERDLQIEDMKSADEFDNSISDSMNDNNKPKKDPEIVSLLDCIEVRRKGSQCIFSF